MSRLFEMVCPLRRGRVLRVAALFMASCPGGCGGPIMRPVAVAPPSLEQGAPLSTSATASNPAPKESNPADLTPPQRPSSPGLIGALRGLMADSPLLESSDSASPLLNSLDEAEAIWSEAKARNREALRRANRQVRLGAATQSPHILLVLIDNVGPSDWESNGSVASRFPEIERLGREGIRFTQAYAGGTTPKTAHWTLMTGKSNGRLPRNRQAVQLLPSSDTLPAAMWRAGYHTAYLGDWSEPADPLQHNFDDWTGFDSVTSVAPFPTSLRTARTTMRIPANADGAQIVSLWNLLRSEAVSILNDSVNSGAPLFLVMRLPAVPPDSDVEGQSVDPRDALLAAVIARMEELEMLRRTCVVVTSLSGAARVNEPAHRLSERQLRVPLLWHWPDRIAAGTTTDQVCVAWDLFPTLLDIARAARRPARLDGKSLLSVLRQRTTHEAPVLYWQSDTEPGAQAARWRDWKAISAPPDLAVRLYRLSDDPHEARDVAAQHPDVLKRLVITPPIKVSQLDSP